MRLNTSTNTEVHGAVLSGLSGRVVADNVSVDARRSGSMLKRWMPVGIYADDLVEEHGIAVHLRNSSCHGRVLRGCILQVSGQEPRTSIPLRWGAFLRMTQAWGEVQGSALLEILEQIAHGSGDPEAVYVFADDRSATGSGGPD